MLLLTIDILTTGSTNTSLVKGAFRYIKENEYKGDYSYAIYLGENGQYYVVPADWSKCFNYEDFKNTVKPGQDIQIGLTKNWIRRPMVASITLNGSDYLSQNCVDNDIHDNKIIVPLMCLGLIIVGLLFYFEKTKSKPIDL